ncbi:NAD(P)H-binding protein [Nocardia noduli]|uniref:NAD(P)H-binding protein n=1 Tax=Nocardia noduli TaxID=2815722 RepID=UPI001C248694|nr:NAD(P)H-binding protein [Nocardia noduli]
MVDIVELGPVYAEATSTEFHLVNRAGGWGARDIAERLAHERGHRYRRPADGGVTEAELDRLVADADAVILSPSLNGGAGVMRQPTDGPTAGRTIGHRILDRLSADRPDVHVVLLSHFLTGHGVNHRNRRIHALALRALEAHLRAGRNPWTVLRATWLSATHDPSYQIRLTQDQYADGLVSTESLARAVLAAIENPEVSAGRTAAVFNLSIPGAAPADLAGQFADLVPDFEARFVREPVAG